MKDEVGEKTVIEFVALRAKMCAYKMLDKMLENKHCKCTKMCVVADNFTFDDDKTCLFDGKTIQRAKVVWR